MLPTFDTPTENLRVGTAQDVAQDGEAHEGVAPNGVALDGAAKHGAGEAGR